MLGNTNLNESFTIQNEICFLELINRVYMEHEIGPSDFIHIEYKGKYGHIKINKRFARFPIEIRFVILETRKDVFNIYFINVENLSRDQRRTIALELSETYGYSHDACSRYLDVSKAVIRNITANKMPNIRSLRRQQEFSLSSQ